MSFLDFPPGFTQVIAVIFGLIVGSFLNVVVARLPKGQSIITPRSRCLSCSARIGWRDNLPVLSWLLLKGRCRRCKSPISVRYPAIELITASLFLITEIRFGMSWRLLVRDWPFVSLLIAIAFIDLDHRIIPDPLSLGGLVLGLGTAWSIRGLGEWGALAGAAIGFGVFYVFAWLYMRSSGRSGLGGGDIKLLAMIGAFTGPLGVLTTILISSVLGSVVGVTWGLVNRRGSLMKVAIPYGPFLVIGALYYYLLGNLLWLPFMNPT